MARKLGQPDGETVAPESPVEADPTRVLRGALMRSADRALGLSLSVIGLSVETVDPEKLSEIDVNAALVLGLTSPDQEGLTGLALLDFEMRNAIIEIQTLGLVLDGAGEDRLVTATDKMMAIPLLRGLLDALAQAQEAAFSPNLTGAQIEPLADLRSAELLLRDCPYRCWQASLQIGATDRQGSVTLLVANPGPPEKTREPVAQNSGWSEALTAAVESAPAQLDAVLCRMTLSLAHIEQFEEGDIVPLLGASLNAIIVEGPNRHEVAQARLGQVRGARAIKLEASAPDIEELDVSVQPDSQVAGIQQAAPVSDVEDEPHQNVA